MANMTMDLTSIIDNPANAKLILSALIGSLIGLEREMAGKDPGLRTFSLICLGSCLFTIISFDVGTSRGMTDPGRIAAQIVVGIGFLGAGTIYRSPDGISGLTTAAFMWVTAAIGMAIGFGHEATAVSAAVIAVLSVIVLRFVNSLLDRIKGTNTPGDNA